MSLVSFALGSYNTRTELLGLFEVVMVDRTSHNFRYDVAKYYETYGSWDAAIAAESFEEFKRSIGSGMRVNYRTETPQFVATDLQRVIRIPGQSAQFQLGAEVTKQLFTDSIELKKSDGSVIGYVLADGAVPLNEVEEIYLQSLRHSWWISALLVIAVSLPLGYFLGGRLTKPINNLISAIGRMSPTALNQKVPVYSKDELGMLSLSFNQMSTDLADFVHVVKNQKEKLSQTEQLLRQGLTNISHELRTPLHISISQAQAMLDGIRKLDKSELTKISSSLDHLSRLVDDLYFLSASEAKAVRVEFEMVDLSRVIRESLDARAELFEQRGFDLTLAIPDKYEYDGDKTRLRQVVENLLSNCQRYSEQGAQINIELRTLDKSVALQVSDNGPGVPEENLEFLFDRFYKGDRSESLASEGLGLGLSVVKTCAEIHGGEATAFLNDKGGLTIQLSLPTSQNGLPTSRG
ncbi:MAG: HAMP domain-containing protein [Acidiferrobacterales bacterium]|nr:HAMP domain-containing protein [Acidiferrobacterales bacterium]